MGNQMFMTAEQSRFVMFWVGICNFGWGIFEMEQQPVSAEIVADEARCYALEDASEIRCLKLKRTCQ